MEQTNVPSLLSVWPLGGHFTFLSLLSLNKALASYFEDGMKMMYVILYDLLIILYKESNKRKDWKAKLLFLKY